MITILNPWYTPKSINKGQNAKPFSISQNSAGEPDKLVE